ncbi:hypothetical protein CROQUDRAFT_664112 [Cronartium quercuum f. sp. fusiforme G11]|uniref:Uncharacterized protein n=1 Tax=Cronartium quercuum f. sp. fusiforme G11 TaxID=708437 RepID=A0A9P6NCE7_9BASI|nr:hypothetical protein CROQUDRAFT_664112 [Cronartium quercuum f. sp. fusiforme G11]
MFRTIYIVFALQAFSTISRSTPQEGSPIAVDLFPEKLILYKHDGWNHAQIYDGHKEPVFITRPGEAPNTIALDTPLGLFQRDVYLTPVFGSCDPVTYRDTDNFFFTFKNGVWTLSNENPHGWGDYTFQPASPSSLLGDIKTIDSPKYAVARITNENPYTIKYKEVFSLQQSYLTAFMIVADEHKARCYPK